MEIFAVMCYQLLPTTGGTSPPSPEILAAAVAHPPAPPHSGTQIMGPIGSNQVRLALNGGGVGAYVKCTDEQLEDPLRESHCRGHSSLQVFTCGKETHG